MTYVRKQKRGRREYYYLVESHREGPKVRQKVLRYLGTGQPSKEYVDFLIRQIKNKVVEVNK